LSVAQLRVTCSASLSFGITFLAGDKVKELAWRVMEGGEAPSDDAPPSVAVVHVGSHDLQGSDTVPGNQTEINAVSTDIINECAHLPRGSERIA
jgi:hypothetical protein